MWYHAITYYEQSERYWWNRSKEDMISDILVPYVTKQVKLVTKGSRKAIFNFGTVSYLTILSSENKIKRPKPGAVPQELKDKDFIKGHDITEEFINEIRLISGSFASRSFLQHMLTKPLKQIFVIMKFNDKEMDSMYEKVIKPSGEEFGYRVIRVDEIQNSGVINQQILELIVKSEVILADLTGERPNCYYEAGFAQALGKEIIFSIKEGENKHFDIQNYRFIQWKNKSDFKKKLRIRLASLTESETD